jgi:integrase/recombinase XerC
MIKLVRGLYIRADIHEVATALAALTGEPHPLAQQA